jgi:hypothetical protein
MRNDTPGAIDILCLLERLKNLQARLAILEEALGDLVAAIEDGTIDRRQARDARAPSPRAGSRKRPFRWSDAAFANLAMPGATLDITPLDTRRYRVSINGAEPLPMPAGRAEFLRLLAAGADDPVHASPSDDGLGPWKERVELGLVTGRDRHGIDVLVERLRLQLYEDFHVSPLLVETGLGGRLRFRLRSRPSANTASRITSDSRQSPSALTRAPSDGYRDGAL